MHSKGANIISYNPFYLVNILLFILSATLGSFYLILSIDYADGLPLIIIEFISLTSIILFLPELIRFIIDRVGGVRKQWWFYSNSFLTIIILSLVSLIGYFLTIHSVPANTYLVIIATPLVLICTALYVYYYFHPIDFVYYILFFILSFYIGSVIWMNGWQGPLFLEQLSLMNLTNVDVLFHSAVIGVIKTHSYPSTGIDGIPYLPYHWGSHWFLANLSNLLNQNGLFISNLGFPVIIIPLYLKSIFYGVFSLRKYKKMDLNINLVFLLVLIAPIIYFTSEVTTVPIDNYSYVMGLTLSFLLFSLCLEYLHGIDGINNNINNLIFLFFILPVFIGIISLVKISLPFIILGLYLYLIFRLRLYGNYVVLLSFLLVGITLLTILLSFTDILSTHSTNLGIISLFQNIIKYGRLSFVLNYAGVVLFIYLFFKKNNITNYYELKSTIKSDNYILELEILPIIFIISLPPGLIGMNAGGADFYFYNFQYWLSIIFILAYLPYFFSNDSQTNFFKDNKLSSYVKILLVIGISFEITSNYYIQVSNNLRHNLQVRSRANDINTDKISLKRAAVNLLNGSNIFGPDIRSTSSYLERNKIYQLLKILSIIDKDELINKRKTSIYIPRSNRVFWDMQNLEYGTPFIVPSLTGIAMISGVPENLNSTSWKGRGYHVYKKDYEKQENNKNVELNIDELKLRARQKGFSNIIKISFINNEFVIERIDA
jgi:hypothetical protein